MRLAALGMAHETNTFSRTPTDYAAFEQSGILRGDEIVHQYANSHATMAGFLDARKAPDVEVVPLLFTFTEPAGTITSDAFERICGEMLDLLRRHGPWDGVLLAQHGAAVSDNFSDMDGEVAARVRGLVGPNVPIGMAPDMHANLSPKMIESVTATVVYRTTPHLDPRPRGLECADIIIRTIKGEIRPVQALEMPPVVLNIIKHFTGEEPMRGIMADVEEVIGRHGMLSASVAEGYPYADVEEMGMSFLAISDRDAAAAREAAAWMARRAWSKRAQFEAPTPSPEAALAAAMAAPNGPVVLMDVGDNIGGGSPADSTVLLEAARRLGVRSYLQTLRDPDAVSACVAAGVGSTISLEVGGKSDEMHGRPVAVTGVVRCISDGRFEEPGNIHGGFRFFNGGTTVVLETEDDHTLVLTTRLIGNMSLQQMYSVGVRPESKHVVVAKGVHSPRPAYEPIAAQVVFVNTPGVTSSDLSRFTYQHRRRPLYPFEPDAAY
jgi:microcystin degradation protein MlrC